MPLEVPGNALLDLVKSADRELVLCAPFAKVHVLEVLLDLMNDSVAVLLYTRWRPEEVAAGVSDTGVLELVESCGGVVMLHNDLHAKFYRSGPKVLLGSANLTGAALGWSRSPNLELLVEGSHADVTALESVLVASSVRATRELANEVESIAKLLPIVPHGVDPLILPNADHDPYWLPTLRHPENLFIVYRGNAESVTTLSAKDACRDLGALDLPPGLNQSQFEHLVGHRLLQQPLVRELDEYLIESRRFGQLRDFIQERTGLDRDAAGVSTQTTSRWLREFLPHRFKSFVPNWTEVVQRVESDPDK